MLLYLFFIWFYWTFRLRCSDNAVWIVYYRFQVLYIANIPFSQLTMIQFCKQLRQATTDSISPSGLDKMICSSFPASTGTPRIRPLLVPKKYQSLELFMKKQLDTTGYSISPSSSKYWVIYRGILSSRISLQILFFLISYNFSFTIRSYQLKSFSTILRYELITVSFLIFSIAQTSSLAAFPGLLSQLPTSRWLSSNRYCRLILQLLDCLSMSSSSLFLFTRPRFNTVKESKAGWMQSTTLSDHESRMYTLFQPNVRRKRDQLQFSTKPTTFQGRTACWLTFLQIPSWIVKMRIRSSLWAAIIFSDWSSFVISLKGVIMRSISPSVSAKAEQVISQSGSMVDSFHPTISPLSPTVSRQSPELLQRVGTWYLKGLEPSWAVSFIICFSSGLFMYLYIY